MSKTLFMKHKKQRITVVFLLKIVRTDCGNVDFTKNL